MTRLEKTYPPEVEELRQKWIAVMAETARRFYPPETGTATEIASYDSSPEAEDRRRRELGEALEPMVRELAKLEGFATMKWLVEADPAG